MINVDYIFYTKEYSGTIISDEGKLKQPMLKANIFLSQIMRQKIQDADQEKLVKLCLCEVSELIYQDSLIRAEHGGRDVKSENTDGYSVTYATEAENGKVAVDSLQGKIYGIIRRYLANTGLLYLGVNHRACKCSDYNI